MEDSIIFCTFARRPKITTGSNLFKNQLTEFFNINNILFSISIKGNEIYDIYILGDSRIDFFNNMYENSSVCLERKFVNYRAALKKFKVKNIGRIAGNPKT